jgi:hypothetical protein
LTGKVVTNIFEKGLQVSAKLRNHQAFAMILLTKKWSFPKKAAFCVRITANRRQTTFR